MPVPPHLRITALGRFGSSNEKFSYGLNLTLDETGGPLPQALTFFDPEADTAILPDLCDDMRNFHARAGSRISYRAILESVKVASIGANGKYTSDPYVKHYADTPGAVDADGGANKVPPQVACAISLGTGRRGPGGRGRFFIPQPVVDLGADCTMADNQRALIQGSAATLINDLNNQPGVDYANLRVVVISTKGTASTVTSVRVGHALDTIRSRRRSLDEAYAVPTAIA